MGKRPYKVRRANDGTDDILYISHANPRDYYRLVYPVRWEGFSIEQYRDGEKVFSMGVAAGGFGQHGGEGAARRDINEMARQTFGE